MKTSFGHIIELFNLWSYKHTRKFIYLFILVQKLGGGEVFIYTLYVKNPINVVCKHYCIKIM